MRVLEACEVSTRCRVLVDCQNDELWLRIAQAFDRYCDWRVDVVRACAGSEACAPAAAKTQSGPIPARS